MTVSPPGGEVGLRDRSSRPRHSPARLFSAAEAEIDALSRQRLSGPGIARQPGRPVSTVAAVLLRLGLGRLAALMPDETQESAVRCLEDALASFASHGVVVDRVMTDHGSA